MSNRLTFSLASLIFLIAFGLVFVPTSVLAHTGPTVQSHSHPTKDLPAIDLNGDGDTTDDGEFPALTGHNIHPRPVITLKENAAQVTGSNVLITTTGNTFTVVISFEDADGKAIAVDDDQTSTDANDAISIHQDTFNVLLLDKKGNPVTGNATIAAAARAGATPTATSPIEALVTIPTASVPTGTADMQTLTIRLALKDGQTTAGNETTIYSLATTIVNDDATISNVDGGFNFLSAVAEFTLVQELPETPVDPPAAPADLKATAGDKKVTLDWKKSTDTSITKYQYSYIPGPPVWVDIPKSDAATKTADVTDLTNGTEYTFYLRAFSTVAGKYSEVKATPMAPLVMPGPVTNLTATAGDAEVTLKWTAPTTGDIGSYQYSYGSAWMDMTGSGPTTVTYTVMGLTNGTEYIFRVRAANASTDPAVMYGTPSNFARATPVKGPDTAPVITITGPTSLSCNPATPNRIKIEVTGAKKLVAGDITVGAGWKIGTDNDPSDADEAIDVIPNGDGSEIGITSVKVGVKANAIGTHAAVSKTFTVGPVLTIPAGGYIVVVRTEHVNTTHLNRPLYLGSLGVAGVPVIIEDWDCMPDLTVFFGRSGAGIGGGAISVKQSHAHTGAAIGKGTVGVSEIMWGSDEGFRFGHTSNIEATVEQWIELHNTNNRSVTVTLFARPSTTVIDGERAPVKADNTEIDRMSNFNIGGAWNVKGQSGNSTLGTDFVSMYRSKNGNPYSHGDNNGKDAGKWHVSTLIYRTDRSSLAGQGATNPVYNFKGTPGRPNTISAVGPVTKTNVPNSPIIFNEVANRRDQTLEWIELKNVSNAAKDLRNYEISIITGVNQEKRLFHFNYGDNHVIVQPGEVLLLVDTDPRYNDDHPVAVGYNVRGGNDQALGLGPDAPRYLVTDFAEGGLPDDGNFVLVLRTSKGDEGYADKKKTRDHLSDAVGWHSNLVAQGPPLYTNLWPFAVYGHPNKSRNKMEVETVHYRRHAGHDPDQGDNNKPEQIALNNAGYTGVGYKRFANRHDRAHGGTPGYDHNGLIKNQASEIATSGVITVSEIMLGQGDGRYPQWIELYNSSDSPVNLHAGDHGWRLVIENYDDGDIPVNRLSGTLNFRSSDVQTILPQQTVLVASTRARSSGSAFFDTSVIFPPTRVFSVWDDARGALDMKRTTDPILSTEGFYIELIDGKNNVSDSVGNLIDSPNRRVAAQKAWELSDITGEIMEGDPRSSILRRYREPKGGDSRGWAPYSASDLMDMGIKAEGWILASKTDFREVRQTWFGHGTDIGSPGITGGRVLPVELSKFRPERLEDGSVAIRWITESEKDNAGFNILRSEDRAGEFTKLNTQLIAGQGTTSERTDYEFVDKTAKPNVVYYYQIQDVSLDGDVEILKITHLRGHVSAAGKAATTWGELKALQ